MRFVTFALVALTLVGAPRAQEGCPLGRAEGYLDAAGVRARLSPNGRLFDDDMTGDWMYEVPKGSGLRPVLMASFGIAGYIVPDSGREPRAAVTFWSDPEFRPGPLGADGEPLADCAVYDRVWVVSRADLDAYERDATATADLVEWPYMLGAPVLDGDGNGANYNLAGGDRPAISGDQTGFWVMNDAAALHRSTGSPPLPLEVRAEAFAKTWSDPAIHYATLYRYQLTYRGDVPLEDAHIALALDADLGWDYKDYLGSDMTLGLGYIYRANNDSVGRYHPYPTAVGALFIEAPSANPSGASEARSFMWFSSGDSGPTYPYSAEEYYRFMTCRWADGTPLTFGEYGYGGTEPTCFLYPAEPGAFWSEGCPQPGCQGYPNYGGDQRFVLSTGPFRLEPGQEETVTLALVWARGSDHLDSVEELKRSARYVRTAYELGVFDPAPLGPPTPTPLPGGIEVERPSPNPFAERAVVRYALPAEARVRLGVYDALGREVAVLADGERAAGPHMAALDGAGVPPGVYFARFTVNGATAAVLPLTRR